MGEGDAKTRKSRPGGIGCFGVGRFGVRRTLRLRPYITLARYRLAALAKLGAHAGDAMAFTCR